MEIKEITQHPNAEKLLICRVDVGSEILTIVTGASNLMVGDKIPAAFPGAILPGGKQILEAELRGVKSFGMLCSDKEDKLSERLLSRGYLSLSAC